MNPTAPVQTKRSFPQAPATRVALALTLGVLASGTAFAQQAATSAAKSQPVAASEQQSDSAPVRAMPGQAPTSPAPVAGPRVTGYLQPGTLDVLKVLPPAPEQGDTRYETDRQVFKDTRAWEGSARWRMASDDAAAGPPDLLRHFSCSVDVELNPANAPKLMLVAQRATRDASREMALAKDRFQRKRPFWTDEGSICRPREELGDTYDYPSGHATAGWMWGLVLAQVAPDRASQILARGRAIGESRVVCGVHNASAVEGGRYTADAVMVIVSTNAEFRADLEAARTELAGLRKTGAKPEAARCAAETALVALPITGKDRKGR